MGEIEGCVASACAVARRSISSWTTGRTVRHVGGFVIARDGRGSLVHVRKGGGECVGCIEVGLYEIVRGLILAGAAKNELAATAVGGPGSRPPSPPSAHCIVAQGSVCLEDMRIDRE